MKRGSTIFLQIVILLFGAGVIAFLLWEPHTELADKVGYLGHNLYYRTQTISRNCSGRFIEL